MLPLRGRPQSSKITMTVGRALTVQDLMLLATAGDSGPKTAPPMIQKLKTRHHSAARLLATGFSIIETANQTGYTPQRVSDLTRDPAFKELVTYYESQIKDKEIDEGIEFQSRLKIIAREATDIIQERLENEPGKIPTSELRQLAAFGLDRTVAPPKTAQPQVSSPTTITFNVGTKDIKPKTIDYDSNEKIIDIESTPEPTEPPDD